MKIRELTPKQPLFLPWPTCSVPITQIELSAGSLRNAPHRNRRRGAAEVLQPQDILKEVDTLNDVSRALHGLAEEHVAISDGLLRVAESVRNMATLLAVLVVTTR